MEDGYWDLFWQTGAPAFYLMRKKEEERPEAPEQTDGG